MADGELAGRAVVVPFLPGVRRASDAEHDSK
jgi:hypothetical protein